MATYTPEPREYELMVLYSPELGEEALETEMSRVAGMLESAGAEIVRTKSTTPWGRRRLAYPIQNFQDAFYVLYSLSSQPGDLDPFERDLKLNTNVIRYLLLRQEKAESPEEEAEAEAAESTDAEGADEAAAETETEAEPAAESTKTETAAPAEGEEQAAASEDGSDDEQA